MLVLRFQATWAACLSEILLTAAQVVTQVLPGRNSQLHVVLSSLLCNHCDMSRLSSFTSVPLQEAIKEATQVERRKKTADLPEEVPAGTTGPGRQVAISSGEAVFQSGAAVEMDRLTGQNECFSNSAPVSPSRNESI